MGARKFTHSDDGGEASFAHRAHSSKKPTRVADPRVRRLAIARLLAGSVSAGASRSEALYNAAVAFRVSESEAESVAVENGIFFPY